MVLQMLVAILSMFPGGVAGIVLAAAALILAGGVLTAALIVASGR